MVWTDPCALVEQTCRGNCCPCCPPPLVQLTLVSGPFANHSLAQDSTSASPLLWGSGRLGKSQCGRSVRPHKSAHHEHILHARTACNRPQALKPGYSLVAYQDSWWSCSWSGPLLQDRSTLCCHSQQSKSLPQALYHSWIQHWCNRNIGSPHTCTLFVGTKRNRRHSPALLRYSCPAGDSPHQCSHAGTCTHSSRGREMYTWAVLLQTSQDQPWHKVYVQHQRRSVIVLSPQCVFKDSGKSFTCYPTLLCKREEKKKKKDAYFSKCKCSNSNFKQPCVITLRLRAPHQHQLQNTVLSHYAGCYDGTWNLPKSSIFAPSLIFSMGKAAVTVLCCNQP